MFNASRRTRLLSTRRSLKTRRLLRRLLLVENLEARTLMAADTLYDAADLRIGASLLANPWSVGLSNSPASGAGNGSGSGVGSISLSDTFKLHSRPTATKTIYMDFDGFTAKLTPWRPNGEIVSPPFDLDGNASSFSDNELINIQKAWQSVSADFAPFDINVTTEDPGEDALVNTGGSDDRWGIRAVITTNNEPAPGTGGVAYLGSFRWGYNKPGASDTPCYVFNLWEGTLAQTVSHEVGHSLDLIHDGTPGPGNTYYPGHGAGETSWGTIMGAGFFKNLTTWSSGGYFNSNNKEDDLSIIASDANGFGFIADEFGDTRGTSSELTGPVNAADRNVISQFGRIEKPSDFDFFRFQVGGGLFDLTIDSYITQVFSKKADGSFATSIESSRFLEGTNLDIEAKLMDESGNIIATSNPPDSLNAQFNLDLSPGIYYLSVDGVGFGNPMADPPVGYTDYGSLGQYLISGSFPVAFGVAVSSSVLEYRENDAPKPITESAKVIDNFPGTYASGSLTVNITTVAGATDFLTLDVSSSPNLTQTGSQISFRDVPIGNLVKLSNAGFRVDFNSKATKQSIEAIVNAIRFEARGESPDTFERSIAITLKKGSAQGATSIQLKVISVNDQPEAFMAQMNDIDEDAKNPPGTKVAVLIDRGIIDKDGTRAKAMVVMDGHIDSDGDWQYDIGNGWKKFGLPPKPEEGLVLGATAGLRFLPKENFNGVVPPLKYYALDPQYVGATSSGTRLVYINPQSVSAPDSVSVLPGQIQQNIKPINDAPFAEYPFLNDSVVQDQIGWKYTLPFPLFTDVDDIGDKLTLSVLTSSGVPLSKTSSWLSFDDKTATFSGIPLNQDVGVRQYIVRASDPSGAYGDAVLTIEVINVNDTPTSIQLVGKAVPENSFGASVGKLSAVDPDAGDTISWSFVDNPGNRFEIRGNEMFLSPTSRFDFEAEPSVKVTVRATDAGSLSLDKEITITVEDVNEFSPEFRPAPLSISEDATVGKPVGMVVASDGDSENKVRFRFFGQAPSQFNIAENGLITVNAKLDFESTPNYRFLVQAYDDGTPSLSTWASVTVSVTNANEFEPVITTETLAIAEDYQLRVPVARVTATDQDNQKLEFSLPSSETRFSINSSSGEISILQANVLDYERSATESLIVIVSDVGLPTIRKSEKVINIAVANANEFPPVITTDQIEISEKYVVGATVAQIKATDADKQSVTFSLPPNETRFSINPSTGDLRLNQTGLLDFERSRTETLTVIATDVGLPMIRSAEKVVTISVTNANEPPTKVSLDTNKVLANISGLGIGRIIIDDPDGPTNYQITSLGERFEVVAGVLALKSGRALSDSEPRFVTVPLLLNDIAGGLTHRADVQIERISNPKPWQNASNPVDVDRDGVVGPLDVLAVINAINNTNSGSLPAPRDGGSLTTAADVDVDGDGRATPLDVLAIVNNINRKPSVGPGGEGEATPSAVDTYFAQYDFESDPVTARSRRAARLRNI